MFENLPHELQSIINKSLASAKFNVSQFDLSKGPELEKAFDNFKGELTKVFAPEEVKTEVKPKPAKKPAKSKK